MTQLKFLLIGIVLLVFSYVSVVAQQQYPVPVCSNSKSQKFVGDRLRLPLPNRAVVKMGRDNDYGEFHIGFGKSRNRVWLSGIYGANATSGEVPKDWLSASSDITRRIWKADEDTGVDTKGKLSNGNFWRYLGRYGESIRYYDVPDDAAKYFDTILEKLCYRAWK